MHTYIATKDIARASCWELGQHHFQHGRDPCSGCVCGHFHHWEPDNSCNYKWGGVWVLFLWWWKITSFYLCSFVIHTQPIHTPTICRWGRATWRVLIIWYKSMMMWLHRVKMKGNLHQGKAQYKRFSITCNIVPTSFRICWNRCGGTILQKCKES